MAKKVVLFIEDNELVAAEDEHGNRLKHFDIPIDAFDDKNVVQKATRPNPPKMEKADSVAVNASPPGECCGWWCTIVNGREVCICVKWC